MNRNNWDYIGENTFASVETARMVMLQVYIWMTMGLLTTAAVAFATIEAGIADNINPMMFFAAFIVELGLVFWLSARVMQMAPGQAIVLFLTYAAVNGFTMSLILMAYTSASVGIAFISTASLFAAMSIVGATTKMDLTKWRTFLMMALIGLLIAMVINIFLASSAMDFVISVAGVLLFTALTAYDTQRIGRMAQAPSLSSDGALVTRVSIMGALVLYLDFINLFIFILRLTGNRR